MRHNLPGLLLFLPLWGLLSALLWRLAPESGTIHCLLAALPLAAILCLPLALAAGLIARLLLR
ncbi:hypothetical protein [Geoalkalibacter halelectricus]|uniref:hypothetical protein n=1 Tax=Geoalkalibacter halelectricus TaxID=2847045 RepID=UPI003D21F884